MSNCPFCKIVKGEISAYIVAKDEKNKCLAFLDINPNSEGHTLIISKKHAKNITELEQTDWKDILPLLKEVVNKLQNTFKEPEIRGFNFISNMNDENIKEEQVTAYQSVQHFHLHVIPRYEKNEGFIWNSKEKRETMNLVTRAADKLKIRSVKN